MTTAIKIDKLTKIYSGSKKPAVNDLSINVHKGEVYGFLGSNGAGKSTTIRLMLDFIRPTHGNIKILGKDSKIESVEIKKHVSYLAGDVALPKKTTGRKLLKYLARLMGGIDEKYLKILEERFQAELDKKTETLSKGNRQKIGLIQAFMGESDVIILDEPTSGLDPLMQEQFYITVEEARNRGATVFLSSHIFSEVEKICDRVGIIRDGKLVFDGQISDIVAHHVPAWQIILQNDSDIEKIKKSKNLKIIGIYRHVITVQPDSNISAALSDLSKINIKSLNVDHDDLEDQFMNFYKKEEE